LRLDARRRPTLVKAPTYFARRETVVGHIVGLSLTIGGLGMLAASIVERIDGGPDASTLLTSALLIGVPGAALWNRTKPSERLSPASIFAAVLSSWIALSLVGVLPYLATGTFANFNEALFEAISGFTTTGSTVLRPIEGASKGILFWRAITQWMGGIGVVVFAVSVLPFLGIGGMDLMAAEAPGPSSERLVPRVRETAKRLVLLYLGFTTVVATLYALFGMSPYDAVAHAFTTVSTGGYSPYNASFAHFDSAALEWIAIAAMVFAGGSFAMWWRALLGKPFAIIRSAEFRAYLAIISLVAFVALAWNVADQGFSHDLARRTIFSTTSLSTSTGYTLLDYDQWRGAVHLLLIFSMGLGGMAGSTTGGFKVFRLLAVLSYGRRQMFRHLHPRAVDVVRLGGDVVPDRIVARVVGFFGFFMAIGGLATFLVAALSGTDPVTAISSVAQSIGNVGPGLGEVGPTMDYLSLERPARGVLVVVMLFGRLEVFPVLLGLVPFMRFLADRLPPRMAQSVTRVFRG